MQKDFSAVLELVHTASDAVMQYYNSADDSSELKNDGSPVTQADKAAHEIIVHGLEQLFPEIPVVSEEGDQQQNATTVRQERFWLVDPIDGTKEFLKKVPEFTVCVALIEHGVATLGIVSVPAQGLVYYGGPGVGGFKQSGTSEPRPIHVSEQKLGIVMGSRSYAEAATADYIAEHYPDAKVESVGSMLKYLYIAEGRADAYPRLDHTMKLWDVAAGDAILTGAGGRLTRPDGSPVDYNNSSLLAGNFVASS